MPNAVTLMGSPVLIEGVLPKVGEHIPEFTLVDKNLDDATLDNFAGKRKVLNIFPSLDTPTCASSVRRFNQLASGMKNAVVLNISADLPFAQNRFCAAEGLDQVINLSTLRGRDMLKNYGVLIVTSKLAGLATRAIIIADEHNVVKHVELVPEIANEPNYQAALRALK
ncbi:thiol peroxidase [Methylotenera sp. N17]|uniref:thiol peroxidase n=1 Tax=Methylotenera sp. N17 TaxID=1502761 RepID=UPI000645EEED|nr:thiol peroxidase [Methylotenera sp. N17]